MVQRTPLIQAVVFLVLLGSRCSAWTSSISQSRQIRRKTCPLSASLFPWLQQQTTSSTNNKTNRNATVTAVLDLARALGPVGVRQPPKRQQELLEKALALQPLSDPAPAQVPLQGLHSLVYSAAPGGSSGKVLGPVAGRVTQEFVNDETFINAVQLGPLSISLTASRVVKSDTVINVSFHQTTVSLFDVPVGNKTITGGGTWKMIFCGVVRDETKDRNTLVRVMETPSLFVIEQPIVD